MSNDEVRLLKMLFYDKGGDFYEVIDGGLRKPAIRTWLADVKESSKEYSPDREVWCVSINWRLLGKWLGGEDE